MDPLALIGVLRYAAPVGLAALGETIVEKTGVINIGLEGQMLFGAFCAMLGSQLTGSPWLGLLLGTLVAVLAGVVQTWLVVNLAADQVVVGAALNFTALGVTGTALSLRYGGESGLEPLAPKVPELGFGLDLVILFMLLAVPLVAWLLTRSRWGLAARAAGEFPDAVEAAGFSVFRLRWTACLIGGAFAGLAGGYLSLGTAGAFTENMTSGRGFVAIAMVTFGRWKPVWVIGASLLVGLVESLQWMLQAQAASVPKELFLALPYLVAIAVLLVAGKGASMPAALGRPYKGSH